MKPAKTKSEIDVRSNAEQLRDIKWERIEVELDSIWVKTSYLNQTQMALLEQLFSKMLTNKFTLIGNVFVAFGQLSATLQINDETWDDNVDKIEYYGQDISRLIDFSKATN